MVQREAHLTSIDSGISKNICEHICKLYSHQTENVVKIYSKKKI